MPQTWPDAPHSIDVQRYSGSKASSYSMLQWGSVNSWMFYIRNKNGYFVISGIAPMHRHLYMSLPFVMCSMLLGWGTASTFHACNHISVCYSKRDIYMNIFFANFIVKKKGRAEITAVNMTWCIRPFTHEWKSERNQRPTFILKGFMHRFKKLPWFSLLEMLVAPYLPTAQCFLEAAWRNLLSRQGRVKQIQEQTELWLVCGKIMWVAIVRSQLPNSSQWLCTWKKNVNLSSPQSLQ